MIDPRYVCQWSVAVATLVLCAQGVAAAPKGTFSIDYQVTIRAKDSKVARVQWDLAGIDEVAEFRLDFDPERFAGFSGSGKVEVRAGHVRWIPGGPYAHLRYRVRIDHARGTQHRYDSYADKDWVITRSRDLFPRIHVDAVPTAKKPPRSRARLIFHLPESWQSVTALETLAPHTFRPDEDGTILDRPRGWIALGKLDVTREEIADIMVEFARAPGAALQPAEVFRFYDQTLPLLVRLFPSRVDRLLVVSGPDPMWHGGLSATNSLFLHGDRPLRTADKTSPPLHELFHVLQPFRASPDADWIAEGLAEYYSLELQRRAAVIDASAFRHGLEYFERYGLWNVDMRKQHDNAATNNSAPLLMHAIDQRIQRATAGAHRLDDAVMDVARSSAVLDTDGFQRAVERAAGRKLSIFFDRHVRQGLPLKPRDKTP